MRSIIGSALKLVYYAPAGESKEGAQMTSDEVIVVIGATGQQGGAVARHLLRAGRHVRALVRDKNKESAQALSKLGAELVQVDIYKRASLDQAFSGAHGVFSVTNFWLPDVGFDGEITQGKQIADAAMEASVQHFIYSSVGAAHRGMGQKHFESKWIVEQYIQEIGLPYTIVRPVAFMDNVEWTRASASNGTIQSMGTRPDKKTQLIAVDDIGAIVAILFSHASEYFGKVLELAGDEISDPEKAEIISRVIGRPVELVQPERKDGYVPDEEMVAAVRFFNGEAYDSDIEAVRGIHPGLKNFETYLEEAGWKDLQPMLVTDKSNAWGG